ncbi:hypothetical protein U1769_09475 [Sphingomonas sp. ZT3P38]|uniref:hypothetical protein n=1 Tax=Parasphingomonas zepuensis TaxID=3096161 RepID=UPI002FC925E6
MSGDFGDVTPTGPDGEPRAPDEREESDEASVVADVEQPDSGGIKGAPIVT